MIIHKRTILITQKGFKEHNKININLQPQNQQVQMNKHAQLH